MNDGKFHFYTIQCRVTHKSTWNEPKSQLNPVTEKQTWFFPSWDVFDISFRPYRADMSMDKIACINDEIHMVWSETGYHGWWNLKYAIQALERVVKDDSLGIYNYTDSYNKVCQAVRHEFRIVSITVSQQTRVIGV